MIVLIEDRGTCSTKHALLCRLSGELGLNIALVHLRAGAHRIDITRASCRIAAEPISEFLHEQDIEPEQIGDFKIVVHQQFLTGWISERKISSFCLADLWRIREACIAALGSTR